VGRGGARGGSASPIDEVPVEDKLGSTRAGYKGVEPATAPSFEKGAWKNQKGGE